MANLLPHSEKIHIQKIYKLRFFVVATMGLLTLIVVGISALLPALFSGFVKEQTARERLSVVAKIISAEDRKNIREKVAEVNKKIVIVAGDVEKSIPISRAIEKIIEHKNPNISLTSFFYTDEKKDTKKRTITISGTSLNRQTLVLFIHALKEEDTFSEVNVPVSNFVRNTDIPFSLLLTIRDHGILE